MSDATSTTSTTDTGATGTQTAQGTFIQPTVQPGAAVGQQQTTGAATAAAGEQQTATQTGQGDGTQTGENGEQETARGSKDAVLADLARERDKRQETEQKLDAVLTALGLKEAGQDVDPKQAAADLAVTRAENAVLRVGAGIADVDALLDSKSFTDSLAKVDANDRAAVKAHIEAFVQANPRYAAQAAGQGPVPAVRDAGAGAHQQPTVGSGDWLRDAISSH
jgi:hypothetical protein